MRSHNGGQVLVMVAIALVVLLGAAALAIDLGFMHSVRHELQRCADAGALAGASYFRDTGYWSNDPNDPQMQSSAARAQDFASKDQVVRSPLVPYSPEIAVSFPEHYQIRVDTQREVSLFFARIFGRDKATVTAYAVAEAFPVTEKVECVVPWGIPVPWTDANNNGIYDAGDSMPPDPFPSEDECKGVGPVTQWDYATHSVVGGRSSRDKYLCQGSLQVLKIGDPSAQMIPGNFFGMDFSGIVASCPPGAPTIGPGANFYSYMIEHSCECDFKVGTGDTLPVDTEPGNMVMKTINPVAPNKYYGYSPAPGGTKPGGPPNSNPYYYEIDSNGNKVTIGSSPDEGSIINGDVGAQWVAGDLNTPGGYPDGGLNGQYSWFDGAGVPAKGNWKDSPRVIRIPVYDPSGTIDGGIHTPTEGKKSFQPLAFVGFWVEDIQYAPPNSGSIVGRFVTVGGFGSGSDTGPTGTPVLSIRLVK